jgi:oxygen-independent coproporphyrinogen III oxidase
VNEQSAGLYIHFPYCVSICSYCDFDRQATGFGAITRYLDAVRAEIALQRRRRIHSIFFGGGTPSLIESAQVESLLATARKHFDVETSCEITLEANPGECTAEHLRAIREAGVNRLSIGVQSLDDDTLARLSRRHSAADAREAVRAARAAGFDNLNLDFMLGLAGMTVDSWRETLEAALELRPDHLSCYILTVDERVPMGRDVARGRIHLPDDDQIADQYDLTGRMLGAAGFEQYEVSNWALPGRASRHNLTYWRDEPYVGVGAGAAGWLGGLRTKNTPSPRRYIASVARGEPERIELERPDRSTRMRDALALGLRLREGIDAGRFRSRFGISLESALGQTGAGFLAAGCLEWHRGRLRVADGSVLVLNELLARLDRELERVGGDGPSGLGLADAQSGAERSKLLPVSGR